MQSYFEMWPQNVESCSHNSKCDCNFQHFAVRYRNLQSRDCNFQNATAIFQNLQSRDCNFRNATAIFQNLQSRDCNFRNMTANSKSDRKIHKYDGKLYWSQLSTFCSHISNYDCNFQHFVVTFRILTATFKICIHISNYNCKMLKVAVTWLQIFKVAITWLQLSTNCSHNSKFDCTFWNLQSRNFSMNNQLWKINYEVDPLTSYTKSYGLDW